MSALFILIGSNVFVILIYFAFIAINGLNNRSLILVSTFFTTNYGFLIITTRLITIMRNLYEKFAALNEIFKY